MDYAILRLATDFFVHHLKTFENDFYKMMCSIEVTHWEKMFQVISRLI